MNKESFWTTWTITTNCKSYSKTRTDWLRPVITVISQYRVLVVFWGLLSSIIYLGYCFYSNFWQAHITLLGFKFPAVIDILFMVILAIDSPFKYIKHVIFWHSNHKMMHAESWLNFMPMNIESEHIFLFLITIPIIICLTFGNIIKLNLRWYLANFINLRKNKYR